MADAAETANSNTLGGRSRVYESLSRDSLEDVTPRTAMLTLTNQQGSAPARIWRLLEAGEKLECMECIPVVSALLYKDHPKTREISAWWLRRRVFGVFGPGEVYEQVIKTARDPNQTENNRAYALDALGEFLLHTGVPVAADAVKNDPSARVRRSAVLALQRLNSEGANAELALAFRDSDEQVRLAAVASVTHIHAFSRIAALAQSLGDESASVRQKAALALGSMRVKDAVMGLIALTTEANEADAHVRAAAVWALGQIADSGARPAVQAASADPAAQVRDAAKIALFRL